MLKIYEGSPLPQMPLQLVATEDLAWLLEQNREDLERLALEPDPIPEFAQIARELFEFKRTEQNLGRWAAGFPCQSWFKFNRAEVLMYLLFSQ